MKRLRVFFISFLTMVFFLVFLAGCGKEEKKQNEVAVGNWIQSRNRAYILLITNPKGEWNSSVRVADATSKIVKSKGTAKGTWHIDKGRMVFMVSESDIEAFWEKNSTRFFDIVELAENRMQLRDKSGRIVVWQKTSGQKTAISDSKSSVILPMAPIAVNINKNRSNDKDRYLCLNLNLVLKELMPDQEIPQIHPKAREAAIIFFSSLVFDDAKDFDSIKNQTKLLVDVLNPYMEGVINKVAIEHVIIVTEMDKVEEFIIEHTLTRESVPEDEKEKS